MKEVIGLTEVAKCELCNRRVALNDRACLNWEWFTGRLDRTHHYCPDHKDSRVVKELRATAYRKPTESAREATQDREGGASE